MTYILMRRNASGATILSLHLSQADADAALLVLTTADAVAWNADRDALYQAGSASPESKTASNFTENYDIQSI